MRDDVTARDDRLRELAQAATPGPWSAREGDLEGKPASEYVRTLLANREADGTSTGRLFLTLAPNPIDPERGAEVVPALTGDGPSAEANAAYIAAASPDVVLGLLDRLAAVEAERDRLAAVVERVEAVADDLAASVVLLAHDAHPVYGNTTGHRGGIGGQAMTPGCSIIDPPPDVIWTQMDMPTEVARDWLRSRDVDLDGIKQRLKDRWIVALSDAGRGK